MTHDTLAGAEAGFVATLPMTVFMAVCFRRLPWRERYPLPPRQITMQAVQSTGMAHRLDEPQRAMTTAVAHFGYGATVGALYGAAAHTIRYANLGVPYGLAVWAASYLGYLPAFGILPPATRHPIRRTALMIGAHVVWGAALGKVFRFLQTGPEGINNRPVLTGRRSARRRGRLGRPNETRNVAAFGRM